MNRTARFLIATALAVTPALAAVAPAPQWVGTWSASPMAVTMDATLANSTYRNIVHISLGGDALRVQLTNEFGTTPLTIGAAHIALSAGSGKIQPGTDHPLTFGGRPTVLIPAGGFVLSDPLPVQAAPMADLVVSVFLPDQPAVAPLATTLAHPPTTLPRAMRPPPPNLAIRAPPNPGASSKESTSASPILAPPPL